MKEYERAVILRLGRLTDRKAKGPGLFFVLPCIDKVEVVDLRTVTLDVPPQEVSGGMSLLFYYSIKKSFSEFPQRLHIEQKIRLNYVEYAVLLTILTT